MHKTSIFIEKARAKHGDRYDYSKVVYERSTDNVIITCLDHGDFYQSPKAHMQGSGCSVCSKRFSYSTAEWIKKVSELHGGKYSYSKVDYKNAKEKVTITCREHGDFKQTPNGHMNGYGCIKCAGILRHTTPEWIVKAKNIHGNTYDYSSVIYVDSHSKVTIRCVTHGFFDQTPTNHLSGKGCPRCPKRFSEPVELYILSDGLGKIKIGYSIDIKYRLSRLNSSSPFKSEIIESWTLEDTPTARSAEHKIHKKLINQNAGLYGFDGATEWFRLSHAKARKAVLEVLHNKNVVSHNVAGNMQLKLI